MKMDFLTLNWHISGLWGFLGVGKTLARRGRHPSAVFVHPVEGGKSAIANPAGPATHLPTASRKST